MENALTQTINGRVVLVATCTGTIANYNLERVFYQEPGYCVGESFST